MVNRVQHNGARGRRGVTSDATLFAREKLWDGLPGMGGGMVDGPQAHGLGQGTLLAVDYKFDIAAGAPASIACS